MSVTPDPATPVRRSPLADVSIVLPVRIDTPDRLRNLELVLAWLGRAFEGQETLVLEHGPAADAAEVARAHGVEHVFVASNGCFHKSRVFNLGLALASRPLVLLYDCDVLLPPDAIVDAIGMLRRDEADYVYPYNGVMLEVACDEREPRELLERAEAWSAAACTGASTGELPAGAVYLNGTVGEPSTGGALACRRRTLLLHGGFNPNIASYGCEDTELETRVAKLGARVRRLPRYNCFHVRHRRGPDSRYNELHAANLAEWKKVEAMSARDLERYVRNGFRALALDASTRIEVVDTPERFSVSVVATPARTSARCAFVLLVRAEPALPTALFGGFVDRLEGAFGDYEIHLIERDGYRFRPVSHRDHVVYTAITGESDYELLLRSARETGRPRLGVMSLFLDAADESLAAALAKVGTSGLRAVEILASTSHPADTDPRARRVLELLRSRIDRGGRSVVFDRPALVDWLETEGRTSSGSRWDDLVGAALTALGPADA